MYNYKDVFLIYVIIALPLEMVHVKLYVLSLLLM